MGYSAIVSIKCDYPGCEVYDEYLDTDHLDHWYMPEGWARVELQMDVEHGDHHDEAEVFGLLCPAHSAEIKERLWPGREVEPRHRGWRR